MQDVVPKGDRSIRNIPVPPNRKGGAGSRSVRREEREDMESRPRGIFRFRFSLLWVVVGAILAALLGLIVASFFEGAQVTVVPKSRTVTIDTEIRAVPDAPVGQLPYQTMKTERSLSQTLAAEGEARVERRASGIITIYNEFGTQSQRLIKNTRFEAPDGKIYRINDSVTVPGAIRKADGTLTPGTIDITVYADSPGADYNKEPAQFTIPGFKGDPRYATFSARSKTALSGGFSGVERVVAEADLVRAVEEIKQELGGALANALTQEMPEGYLLVPGSPRFSFDEPLRESQDEDVLLTVRGVIVAPIVRERDLASSISRLTIDDYEGEAVLFRDASMVGLSLKATSGIIGTDPITLAVTGTPTVVWQFDAEGLKADLAGKGRTIFETVIAGYKPEIVRAKASIRPFFSGSFPEKTERITVLVEVEE